MLSNLFWFFVDIFYLPAYFFFGFINVLFQAAGIGKHEIVSCQTASILYIPVWLIILTLVYYVLHKTRKVEKQLQFISRHRHVFLFLYAFLVLWMYSIPVGCEDVWELVPGGLFIHRGMPLHFSGASYERILVEYPFINLFYTEIPSHRVVWYIPNMLTNFAIILGITYLVYWKLKYIPHHIHRHRRKKKK
ncbi:hypothetical protein HY469_02260 [Candidatus Roizmanbacteria bacterium]|nr:hypothetical protein [Candidatus Roizmanbacteria bacterium]